MEPEAGRKASSPSAAEGPGGSLDRWPCRFLRVRDGADPQPMQGTVVAEEPLEIRIQGRTVAVLMRTPGHEKELAVGYALGEGLIRSFDDVALVQHCGRLVLDSETAQDPLDVSRNRVHITLREGATLGTPGSEVAPLIRSGCGAVRLDEVDLHVAPLQRDDLRVSRAVVAGLSAQMPPRQQAYRESGGIHAAAIFTPEGRLVVLLEDVGRHNAVDKVTGYCLLRGIPLGDKILVSTGRASSDMVVKAVRLGIPIVASRSSPTSLAVQWAERLHCTLLGYLRRGQFRIYAHPWRIAL
ncbi:MAG: formate dehydrogenase accessory sulfurtransferase FdhD [Anaerolineae bacterium]|nr:formate dehydrogenase accessory sulfurtransferase FdhD [Anaerolineae bacterium]